MHVLCLLGVFLWGAVELDTEPAWESADNDFSTGGVLADIDDDGDLDLVTGNGNDMDRDPNRVYYNENDMLEDTASWSSADIAWNGHISLGDMDADGDLDLAVAGFAGGGWVSDPSRVYLNEEGTFASNPAWLGADTLHAFSCDWGDADADGDLDLAIAAGNEYNDRRQKVVIYENSDGVLSAEPMWESDDADYNMDVCWVDIDGDGDLDLAAGGYETNRIYFMENGTLNQQAGWVSADSHHTVQIAFADFDRDGDMDMAAGDNNQIGDDQSRVRVYLNQDGTLDALPFWESKLWRYQSCVAWGDVDADGDLDLAAGGWWEPLSVYENIEGTFDTLPAWSWGTLNPYDLVCEQVIWGEINNDHWKWTKEDFGTRDAGEAVYPSHFPALDITQVWIDDEQAGPGEFFWNPADGWILLCKPGEVKVGYYYSEYPDLVVTNWASSPGNFLFLNREQQVSPPQDALVSLPKTIFSRGEPLHLIITSNIQISRVVLYDITGRRLAVHNSSNITNNYRLPFETSSLPSGVYMIYIHSDTKPITLRFHLL